MIREAGWPIFPVLFFGIAAMAVAFRHALVPQRTAPPLCIGLVAATGVMGVLGTVLGLQRSLSVVGEVPPELRYIVLIGLRESLHNLVAASVLVLGAVLLVTVGVHRGGREPAA